MDRTDIAWLLRVQQDLKDSPLSFFIMERIAKRFRETTERTEQTSNEHEEVLTRNLCGSRRSNMDQRTTKK